MPEPTTIAGTDLMSRIRGIIARRGLPELPIDNTPRPDEPGHPAYHHQQRVNAALAKLAVAVPPRYRDATATHPAVCQWADQVAAKPEEAPSLLLWGPTGTGKTHEAFGAVRRIAETGPTRFGFYATTFPDLYAALRPRGGDDLERDRLMRRVLEVPLLLLDDLGTSKDSEWTEEINYRIINHRYNRMLPTIITTNLPPRSLPEACGDRVASRLIGMTRRVELGGDDRRLRR